MSKITIYTTKYCPYCVAAKELLKAKGIPYEEISLEGKPDELAALKQRTGHRTVPQIFIDDVLIGGFNELSALDRTGELDKHLQ